MVVGRWRRVTQTLSIIPALCLLTPKVFLRTLIHLSCLLGSSTQFLQNISQKPVPWHFQQAQRQVMLESIFGGADGSVTRNEGAPRTAALWVLLWGNVGARALIVVF
jgi:hypothetical protein